MAVEHIPIILGCGLYPTEREKLDRLDERLTSAFAAAGYFDVWHCYGIGRGDHRYLVFLRGVIGSALISFTAFEFLSKTGEKLSDKILNRLTNVNTN